MDLRRWTPLTFLFPRRYIETGSRWADFDLRSWATDEYEWRQDRWNGLIDLAKRPSETVSSGRGDCEDFALTAASWATARNRAGVGLGICWERTRPWPTHVIAFDDDYVYSSGDVLRSTVEDWLEDSKYVYVLRRPIG